MSDTAKTTPAEATTEPTAKKRQSTHPRDAVAGAFAALGFGGSGILALLLVIEIVFIGTALADGKSFQAWEFFNFFAPLYKWPFLAACVGLSAALMLQTPEKKAQATTKHNLQVPKAILSEWRRLQGHLAFDEARATIILADATALFNEATAAGKLDEYLPVILETLQRKIAAASEAKGLVQEGDEAVEASRQDVRLADLLTQLENS